MQEHDDINDMSFILKALCILMCTRIDFVLTAVATFVKCSKSFACITFLLPHNNAVK